MARYTYILGLSLFLASCAQVGTITGGEKDVHAPKPVTDKVKPPNEATNYNGKQLEITFDEYFRLSNPVANIIMIPPHAQINASVKKKTLLLSWEEELHENTTYAIYLNNAVKDIAEGNDSVMQFVFSTGPVIDSLTYSVRVVDAWTALPVSKCIVALFDIDNNEIVNFAETKTNGQARLNYISPGSYKIIAFKDENLDLQPQPSEAIGFPADEEIIINTSIRDTVPIRLFKSEPEQRVKQSKAMSTGKVFVSTMKRIDSAAVQMKVNGIPESSNFRWASGDSLILLTTDAGNETLNLIFSSTELKDTLRILRRSVMSDPVIKLQKKSAFFKPNETVVLETNAMITEIDTAKIKVISALDSSVVQIEKVHYNLDLLSFTFESKFSGELRVVLEAGAVTNVLGPNNEMSFSLTYRVKEDYGSILLDISDYSEPLIIYLMEHSKPVKTIAVDAHSKEVLFDYLPPGEYSFKVVVDENNNTFWDTGSFEDRKQPEPVHLYTEKTKVRANWDASVKLTRIR